MSKFLKVCYICRECGGEITHGTLCKTFKECEDQEIANEYMTCSTVEIMIL